MQEKNMNEQIVKLEKLIDDLNEKMRKSHGKFGRRTERFTTFLTIIL